MTFQYVCDYKVLECDILRIVSPRKPWFVVFEKYLNQILEQLKCEDGVRSALSKASASFHKSFCGTFHCSLMTLANMVFGDRYEELPKALYMYLSSKTPCGSSY